MKPLEVVFFQRRPVSGHYSMEGYFDQVRSHLPARIRPRTEICRFVSRGLLRRLYNAVEAGLRRGEVNHVTGDVHYLTLFLPRHRTLLTIHDCEPLDRMKGLKRQVMLWVWYRIPVRRARLVTVNSEATKRELLKWVSTEPDRVRVVPVSISGDFRPAPKDFGDACPRILQVGTAHNKNLLRLAEALRDVRCRLDVVGRLSGEQRDALERNGIDYEAASDLGRFELVAWYERADLVAFVSTYEGFGMPILEAQAVGRPVVTSEVLSMPDVAGEGACLVDPFDPSSIRAGVRRVIEDRAYRETLVAAGFENVRRFDPARIAERYAAIYETLGGRAGSLAAEGTAV